MSASKTRERDDFEVERWVGLLGRLIHGRPGLWIRMGNLETRLVADELEAVDIREPVYVTGLARSGSTILLEVLNRHAALASHRYSDYPPVFTPYWWNRFLERMPKREVAPSERAHKDGIVVTPDSPEAFEEVLWMSFFPHLHDPARSAVLDETTSHPEFEAFYRDHVRKLLHVRRRARYLAKGNYNLTRLAYLYKLFPAARFVIPVRQPVWHIASLMKQHALFADGERRHPEALAHLQRVGHFEFGLDRRPINTGDGAETARIVEAWRRGDEVEGWARYWSALHAYLADQLAARPDLSEAAMVVRFEDLCRAPKETIAAILDHCRLEASAAWIDEVAATIHPPSYYAPRFTADEMATIERLTLATAARFGYDSAAGHAAPRERVDAGDRGDTRPAGGVAS